MCRAALVCLALLPSAAATAAETLQLRIAWGGGAERIWQGSIRLSQGRFSDLKTLGIEADEPGSIYLDPAGIEIRERSLRAYDGVDVTVTADLDARLIVTLADETGEAGKNLEIALRDLVHQSHSSTLDTAENRLLVSRSPGDRLRIRFARENLVFAPRESFQFELGAHLLDSVGTPLRFSAQILTNPGGQKVWSQEYEMGDAGTTTSIELKVPEFEGVYDLSIAAVPKRNRAARLLQRAVAERKVQLIVLDKRPQGDVGQGPLSRVVEINPVMRWWERFNNLPLPGLRKGPLGNGDAAQWEHPMLGPMVQLGPGGASPNISWEAYPLPISKPGAVHLLEIEYPSDVPQSMGLSILEPNAAGAVMPIGLDSGVYVSDEDAENQAQMAKHRMLFWPRTKTPVLLVTNRRQGSRAVYGKITVVSTAHSQLAALALGRTDGNGLLGPAFPGQQKQERLWAGYMDRPLFVENFGAPETLDPISHRSLDDWNTIYQGGIRLVKYLKHVGYGGLMMSTFADGSTIYPSQVLEPTPRYDTGLFFGSGQDPTRKDSLELLFRLFDRENLVLIPGLHFASPLPELEALKRDGGKAAIGIEWIGSDGAPWLSSHAPRQGLAPYYNLLHPRVQEVMLKAAREVVTRYAAHPSFGGLALQLSAEGYAQLPGEDWGYDDHTIAQFEAATKTQVPGIGPARFATRAKYLSGPGRAAWLPWRAGVVADFHRRLESEISTARGGAKLYLAGGTMLDSRHTQQRLRPTLPKRAKLDDTLMELGIRAQGYRDDEGIVLLRPQHLKPTAGPLPAQAADLEINLAPEMDKLFANNHEAASLFYHEPQKTRLASFDLKSPFGPANTYTWLVSQMSPSGSRNRRRFVHSLATLDSQAMFDGGWLLPLGQEESLNDILSVYRLLPSHPFDTLGGEFQPVTIRTLVHERQTYVYFVNDSPWDVSVSLQLDIGGEAKMEPLGESRGIAPVTRTNNSTGWKIALKPFDLVAARFNSASVRLRSPQVVIPDQVRQNLHRRIQDLGARVAALANPQPLPVLENANFEIAPQGDQIRGWMATATAGGSVLVDPQHKHGGARSIQLVSDGQPVSIISTPFTPPTTGRMAVELWLRGGEQGIPSVRIALEGQLRDGKFDPYGIIPAVPPGTTPPGEWVRYSFPVDDVPCEGLTNVSIRLDLLSAGEVWVDDIQVFDLSFNDGERLELSKLISLASVELDAGQLADCSRRLEGYWPQFLLTNVPLTQTPAPLAQRPRTSPAPAAAPPKKPTVLENLKGYLPKLQR